MDQVRYAIIGFGGIAEARIAREGFALDRTRFSPLAEAELVGATDINPARRANAEALGLKWYSSADAVLQDPGIDAVFIATANSSHAAIGMAALNAGKHCLVEKPLATTLRDAEAMQAFAEKKKLCLMVDHMMTRNVLNRKARELIGQGRIGTVNDLHLHMEFLYGSTPQEAASWRCSDPSEFGGPIGDVASHCFYMAEFLTGSMISSLACVYMPKRLKINVEDGAFIRFSLKNGIQGSISVSFADPRGGLAGTLRNLGYEIYGSTGICRSYGTMFQLSGHPGEPVNMSLVIDDGRSCEKIPVSVPMNIYQETIREHADSVRSGKSGGHAAEAVHNLRLVLAAHESAKNGGKQQEI